MINVRSRECMHICFSIDSVQARHCCDMLLTIACGAAAPTAITINGGEPMAGAAYFVIKPDIVDGQFMVDLIAQGCAKYN